MVGNYLRDVGWVFLVTMWPLTLVLGAEAWSIYWLGVILFTSIAGVAFVKAVTAHE